MPWIWLDFGFSNDPAAMVGVYRYNGTIYVDEIVYQTGTLNKDLIEIMKAKGVKRNATIYADSAEQRVSLKYKRLVLIAVHAIRQKTTKGMAYS